MKTLVLFLILTITFLRAFNQVNECATDVFHNYKLQTDSVYSNSISNLEKNVKIHLQDQSLNFHGDVYTIPVVVHVVHLGEAVGTGTNISDAQIISAIQGANNRWANTGGTSVDMQMQFCLATRDPNGNPTTGINRVNGSAIALYSTEGINIGGCSTGANEESIKSLSRWPVSSYYNIWVVREICNGGYGGWAYYPNGGVNDGTVIIPGLMTSSSSILAHEIGHGFFLYHTFEGDGGNTTCPTNTSCIDNGDRVCDTPPHKQGDCSTSNPCTASGVWFNSRYNYMSYCGSLDRFTTGQKNRARAVASVSPRLSLLTSLGCIPVSANDAGIDEITYPVKSTYSGSCTFPNSISPIVIVKNYGTSNLTSATINYRLDNGVVNTVAWSGNLAFNASVSYTLPLISLSSGAHTLKVYTTNPNGASEGFLLNDTSEISFEYKMIVPFEISGSQTNPNCFGSSNGSAQVNTNSITNIKEDWESTTDWIMVNGSQVNQWFVGTAVANGGTKSIYISDNSNANNYTLTSTSIVHFYKDFYFPSNVTNITVKFDWRGQGQSSVDYLRVYLVPVSTIPAADYQLSSGQIGSTYSLQAAFSTVTITGLNSNAGQAKRLVFSWRNDISSGTQPPAAIDNIIVSYTPVSLPAYTYSWNTSPVQTGNPAVNLSAGLYDVVVTHQNTCTRSMSFTLTQPSQFPVSVTPGGPTTFCTGGSVLLTSSGAIGYLWNTGQTTQSITVSAGGNYFVTATNASGCTASSSPVTITVNPCSVTLNIKLFIEGYYSGSGEMNPVVDPVQYPQLCDTVDIELHDATSPYELVYSQTGTIDIQGEGSFIFPQAVQGSSYYIVVRHRQSIETWSKFPVLFNSSSIDFDLTIY